MQSTPDVLTKAAMITDTGGDDTSHRLIHMIPNESFEPASRNFASKYVTDLICSHFKRTSSDRLQLFLSDIAHVSETKSSTGVLLGKLLKRHCKEVMLPEDVSKFETSIVGKKAEERFI